MAMAFKPHTVTVTPTEENITARNITGYTPGSTFSLDCHVSEKSPTKAYNEFGAELRSPAFLMCEIDDAPSLEAGDKVEMADGRVFYVQAGPKIKDASEGLVDYALFLLARTE